ncbi:hypothetical protein COLO4_28527 [Corchorus olitorius]|uniref:Uncharacterized protein n=1 Tax=Corchorus olitorius TaxID=93759 RepID=A0A1R3HK93_9ROSI|nr:hypothetical protein COLO4_28527 [Corchorus olitorius]
MFYMDRKIVEFSSTFSTFRYRDHFGEDLVAKVLIFFPAAAFVLFKIGLLKLRKDIRSCEYEDVRVMWEMLKRNETEMSRSPKRCKKRSLSNCLEWARRAPFLCRSF